MPSFLLCFKESTTEIKAQKLFFKRFQSNFLQAVGSPQKLIIRGRRKTRILVVSKIFYNSKTFFCDVADPYMTIALAPTLAEAPSAPPLAFNHINPIPWGGQLPPPTGPNYAPVCVEFALLKVH